jgi:hypothetical protein
MDIFGAVQALGGIIPAYAEQIFGGSNTDRIPDLVIQTNDRCINAKHRLALHLGPPGPRDWRELNTITDYISKLGTGNAFSFTAQPWVHTCLGSRFKFGKHTIDWFASRNNVQVLPPRYNSLYLETEAEWLDAFSFTGPGPHNWNTKLENNWIRPSYKVVVPTA